MEGFRLFEQVHPPYPSTILLTLLDRPRVRLQAPLTTFRPSATLRADATSTINFSGESYLPSGIPGSLNLLASLKDEPSLKGVPPQLPALRLSRIIPTSSNLATNDQTIRVATQPTFRTIPAVSARVRYSKASITAGIPTIIASLDIETATYLGKDISLRSVNMQLAEGSAEDLGKGYAPSLPMTCSPGDNPTFLFRLTPYDALVEGMRYNSNSSTLDISIDATILTSKVCQPHIEMRWRTGVDFSTALNPSFGAPNQSMQRSKRPANITMHKALSNEIAAPVSDRTSNDGSTDRRERAASLNDLGICVTFTAPKIVYVGKPFSWDIFVVNRSGKARKLALLALPKRRRGDSKVHLSRPSTSSTEGRKDGGIADAVTDENLLFAMQRNASKEAVQLISLGNDMIIGYSILLTKPNALLTWE